MEILKLTVLAFVILFIAMLILGDKRECSFKIFRNIFLSTSAFVIGCGIGQAIANTIIAIYLWQQGID